MKGAAHLSQSTRADIVHRDYTELQVGPAPTQMHTFPIAANSTYQWSEWFKGFRADATRVHSSNYSDALNEVNTWMASERGLDQEKFKETDAWLASLSQRSPMPGDILYQGGDSH